MSDPGGVTVERLTRLNFEEFLRELARWSGSSGVIEERDGLLLYATGTDFPVTCNGVVRLDPELDPSWVVDVADSWFAQRSRGYTLNLRAGAASPDADLEAVALERGLLHIGDSPAMVCRAPLAASELPRGVELNWVGDDGSLREFVDVSDASYQSLGMPAGVIATMCSALDRMAEPHLHTVVAREQGRPVAAAQTLLSHGIGGVYYVGTVESARGRGLADLVTRAVTNRAFERGAAFASLQATAMGESVYRRMGYEEIGRYHGWVRFV